MRDPQQQRVQLPQQAVLSTQQPLRQPQQCEHSSGGSRQQHQLHRCQHQQRHCHRGTSPPLLSLLLAVAAAALLVLPPGAHAAPTVDITLGAPTAKTASISYLWGLQSSVAPAAVSMPFAEKRDVSVCWAGLLCWAVLVGSLGGATALCCMDSGGQGSSWVVVACVST
jgi:hypothetical protein